MKSFNSCGDSHYCGSFCECDDCVHNKCPLPFVRGIVGFDFGYYTEFLAWPALDWLVCVPLK